MKNRKPQRQRGRRRQRLFLQLMASISVSAGAVGYAGELDYFDGSDRLPRQAYYAANPSVIRPPVRMLAAQQVLGAQPQVEEVPAVPVPDPVADKFLAEEAKLNALEHPVTKEDVDAVVEGALLPPIDSQVDSPSDSPIDLPETVLMQPPLLVPIADSGGLPMSFGATAGSYSAAPAMIGDFFGGSFLNGSLFGSTVALAGGDRRFKVAENVSPIPRDRVFFNFNHFENALVDINGNSHSLDRYTFGFETTFLDGLASIETRIPFSGALDTTQVAGSPNTTATEFGNMAFAFKANLMSGDCWMLSGGTTMTLPTGDDYDEVVGTSRVLRVENDAVHLAPFLGWLTRPNRCWFAQGFVQADFDLNGNDVLTGRNNFAGVLQDQNLLFVDASIGRWLHRNCDPCARVSAIAGILELHYTTTMNDTDGVAGVSNPFNRMDILNATGALSVHIGKSTLRVGGAAPLRDDEERLFDAEVIVQFNRYF